jgi:hypothetical protein
MSAQLPLAKDEIFHSKVKQGFTFVKNAFISQIVTTQVLNAAG